MAVPLRSVSGVAGAAFVERAPSPALRGVVACTWTGRPGPPRTLRVLPDGCTDLVWDGRRLRVAGAGVTACRHEVATTAVGARLRIGAAGRVLGRPAHEIPAEGVDLDGLWGPRAARWEDRLADAPDPGAVLEALVADRLRDARAPDPVVAAAVRRLGGGERVDAVGSAVGISPRELRRRLHRDVGYGPKALARVLRFRRVLARLGPLAAGTATIAGVAGELGYVDQAHLSRECRALAGTSPGRLVAQWARHDRLGRKVHDGPSPRR